jgi:hydroxymethylpyrimidine pyrophosphatase-like HAD family hydrolase
MIVHVLASDYDGTIAEAGRVSERTRAALERVRESGRKLLLVTGRMLPDLRLVCPDVDALFDAVVAENGAVLSLPSRRETKVIGERPEPGLVDALTRRQVPFDLGSAIVATRATFADAALAAIRDAGVERSLVFNKGSLMLMPAGVTKGTGLEAALGALGLSPHNVVGIGDAENDHAFLALCEFAIAVADAVPALRERADHVTREPGARGVVEFIEQHLLADLVDLAPRITRHLVPIGETPDGETVALPAHGTRLLVVGPSASGKSTITGVIVERLGDRGRSFCLFDPEGDHQTLAELERVLVLGGRTERALPDAGELAQLLRRPGSSVVLNLSALERREKVEYATRALATVAGVRGASGLPHWLIVDEAHHLFPADGSPATDLIGRGTDVVALVALDAGSLARDLLSAPNVLVSTDVDGFREALGTMLAARGAESSVPAPVGDPLGRAEAVIAWLGGGRPRMARFRVARRRLPHRRHVRKYAEGELPPERSFYFRGAEGALNLRAPNLVRFCELGDGVDATTWTYHLARRDYSAWIRKEIKDGELADEVAAVESSTDLPVSESRRRVIDAIRRRYTV